jgi:hypothetical protein
MHEAELFLLFVRPLNRAGIRYVVGGSVAAIFYGEPRLTIDVDVMVFLRDADAARLAEIFPSPEFYVPPVEVIRDEIRRPAQGQFNLIHSPTSFKADVFTTGRDDFNAWAFRARREILFRGERVFLAPPKFVIVRKLEYFRDGGSEEHVRDIRGILAISGDQLDRPSLAEWIRERGVDAEWRQIAGDWLARS